MSKFWQALKRLTIVSLTVLGITAGTVAIAAAPANASATRCTYTKVIEIRGATVPLGQYCFSVIGGGLHVDFTSGSWHGPWVEYPAERVTFYDQYGTAYASWITYSGSGRTYGYRYWRSGITGTARIGSTCGEFMSYGTVLGSVCHNIKP